MQKKLLVSCLTGIIMLGFAALNTAFAAWENVTPASSTKTLYAIWGTSASNVYAVGMDGALLHCDGTTWTAEISSTTEKLNAIWGVNETNIYVVGDNGALLHKTAAGTTWAVETESLKDVDGSNLSTTDFYSVRGSSAANVYMGSINGWFIRFNGTAWTEYDPAPPTGSSKIAGIWPFNSTNIYCSTAAGDYGRVFHYDGNSWEQVYGGGAGIALYSIWGNTISDIYVAGSTGLILQFNGTEWLTIGSGTTQKLYSIWGSSASNVFAVGVQGTIVHNRGAGFVAENFSTTNDLFGVWVAPDGSIAYAVGTDGMILKYTPDAVTTTTTTGGATTTTTVSGGTTTTTTAGGTSTTTTVSGGTTTTISGSYTTSIVPEGEVGADFIGSPLTGKAPLPVQFTNLSGGDIATYQWVFGDGAVSTEKNPSHVYEKAGTYSIILTVFGTDNTKSATKTRDNYITVKRSCALASSLASPGQLSLLRDLRDSKLETSGGILLTALYYRNTAEINEILDDYPELRLELQELVGDNIAICRGLLSGEPVVLSGAVLADVSDFLDKLSAHGSMPLQRDIDLIMTGIYNGYFLSALGITLK